MKKPVTLILALSLILTLTVYISFVRNPVTVYAQDGDELPDQNDVEPVIIALTRLEVNDLILDFNDQSLEVNDLTLELRYKVRNNSDQDIWVCNGVGWVQYDDDTLDYEAYYEEESQTIVIRRRLDVPLFVVYYIWPQGRYVRLRAGEERSESLSLKIPVRHNWLFKPILEKPGIIFARRLVIEIGYLTKDLLSIKDVYVKGPDEVIISALDAGIFIGEHILMATVDGVHIPYEELWVGYYDANIDE